MFKETIIELLTYTIIITLACVDDLLFIISDLPF